MYLQQRSEDEQHYYYVLCKQIKRYVSTDINKNIHIMRK